ncbi:putative nucleotidyltransferase [Pyrobaculum sp. WP30]|nr:putative nucleotidyltransferase [Pyrobaculum sp. WP30]
MDLRGVVGREEVEMLRERALMFLAAARDDLRAGREAAFHAEQACRLALKYVLASRAGYYPHTHSLRRLFEEVGLLSRSFGVSTRGTCSPLRLCLPGGPVSAAAVQQRCDGASGQGGGGAGGAMYVERGLRWREVLERWRLYVERLCRRARELLGEVRVVVFGSVARGDWSADSDIDVLVISPNAPEDPWERAKVAAALREAAGEAAALLELHIVRPEQYLGWYKRFIDAEVEVC